MLVVDLAVGADGFRLSNPCVLSLACLLSSLRVFNLTTMQALREKSMMQTAYLVHLLKSIPQTTTRFVILTPDDPQSRGCQISISFNGSARAIFDCLEARGVVCDFREPSCIRIAPTPLYNTFDDIWTFAGLLQQAIDDCCSLNATSGRSD